MAPVRPHGGMHAGNMPPAPSKEDLRATWAYLESGIDRMMNHFAEGIDMQSYMGLYTAVHNFCTSQKAVTHNSSVPTNTPQKGAHLLGEDLYSQLTDYLAGNLNNLVKEAQTHSGEVLLQFYNREWQRFTNSAKYIHHVFRYLNRHWVKRECDEGKKNIFDVYTLHLVQWQAVLFKVIQKDVMDAALKLIEKHRNGETIEQNQIKAIVDSFVMLGHEENKQTLDTYRHYFEEPFINATREYYKHESQQFLIENSVVEYMKKAEARLKEEEERVTAYLHRDVRNALVRACNDVLIADHKALLHDEFQNLLDNEREEDMARMYSLLSNMQNGLEPLKQKFETHVRRVGLAAVSKVAAEAEKQQKMDPKLYVDALLETHNKFQSLVKRAFVDDPELTRSLDGACREFVNRNELCKTSTTKSPEIIAKYTDMLLRRSGIAMEDTELEATLSNIMTVFKYIDDKDVFQKFYARMLARRLVHSGSSSAEAETSMIIKLKEACGFEYTNKLQRMFQDVQLSKDLNQAFAAYDRNGSSLPDPHYSILGTGFWPLSAPTTTFMPPKEMQHDCDRFVAFYRSRHEGRKLTWLWQLCKGEVKANYTKNKTPYTFQVSAYQMAILLLFNDRDQMSYNDLLTETSLEPESFDPAMAVLLKAKVLLAPDDKIGPGTIYKLNFNFKNKKVRINLNIPPKTEQKQEETDTFNYIEEDRKILLQSVIVRIMKARKVMTHAQLVSETINQIKSRFVPQVQDIKKGIETLLDKEYLERLEGDELGYLA